MHTRLRIRCIYHSTMRVLTIQQRPEAKNRTSTKEPRLIEYANLLFEQKLSGTTELDMVTTACSSRAPCLSRTPCTSGRRTSAQSRSCGAVTPSTCARTFEIAFCGFPLPISPIIRNSPNEPTNPPYSRAKIITKLQLEGGNREIIAITLNSTLTGIGEKKSTGFLYRENCPVAAH